jgi:WW domain-containing oxidoreductase
MAPPARVPDSILNNSTFLKGKNVVITGGAAGIGFETTKYLAKLGAAHIIVGSRNQQIALTALESIKKETNCSTVLEYIPLDLASLENTRKFAATIIEKSVPIHFLILNAGLINSSITGDGFESMFQVNHLGHFLLANLLFENLVANNTRVITVSSETHAWTKDIYPETAKSAPSMLGLNDAYSHSKLCNVLFAKGLQQKFDKLDTKAVSVSLHPGMVQTELSSGTPWLVHKFMKHVVLPAFGLTVEEGAQTTIHCVVTESLVPGAYYEKCAVGTESEYSKDQKKIDKLWEYSLRYTGL